MSTLLRIDTLVEVLRAQLEHGGMTYEEAVVTEDFLSVLEQTRAQVPENDQTSQPPCSALKGEHGGFQEPSGGC